MTDEEKAKAVDAAKDKRIADLEDQLAKAKVGQAKPADDADLTPYPTQAQLNELASGGTLEPQKGAGYKTRVAKAD